MSRLRRRSPLFVGLGVTLALVLSGCAMSLDGDTPQTSLNPKGSEAETIHNTLVVPIFVISGIVFVLVMAAAVYVAVRFRAKDDADYDEFPEQLHGNFKLEIGWTILPAAILAIVAFFNVAGVFDLARKPEQGALKVEVIGQQWWWEYRYSFDVDGDGEADEIITANDLVIPADREIGLRIKSNDVIHSWWAPASRRHRGSYR